MPAPNELPLFAVSLKHGYYSREAKAERSRVRAAIHAVRYLRDSI
jgi:hypothetical protein